MLTNDESYVARVARKKLTIGAGEPAQADATIAGDPRAFASVTYGGRPLADPVATGDLRNGGHRLHEWLGEPVSEHPHFDRGLSGRPPTTKT